MTKGLLLCYLGLQKYRLLPLWLSSQHMSLSTMSLNNTADVIERKNRLRLEIKRKVKELSVTEKLEQTYLITSRLVQHPDFQRAERIAIYVNMKNEVGTYDILKEAFSTHKKVFIPMVTGDNMTMVKLNSLNELNTMPKTKWGIIQPLESDGREDCLKTGGVQYVVVPGVAFTHDGLRMGHGKGYYDKFLAKNDEVTGSRCLTAGVAFNEQIVEDLPTTENDIRMTWVIYPKAFPLFTKYIEIPDLSPPPEPFTI